MVSGIILWWQLYNGPTFFCSVCVSRRLAAEDRILNSSSTSSSAGKKILFQALHTFMNLFFMIKLNKLNF